MLGLVTENQCREILQRQNSSNILETYEVKPLEQESLGGLIGLHYILTIKYKCTDNDSKTLQLFLKTLNNHNKVMFGISQNLLFYEKEKLIFTELLPKFERTGINVAFAPKGYLCENNAVILEDLNLSDFKLFPKEKSLDLKHCYACLAIIAEFHASSLLFEICNSKSLGKKYDLLDDYSYILRDLIYSGGDTDGTRYALKSVEGLTALAELEFDDKTTLAELKTVLDSGASLDYSDLCCVLLHGDLWTNNFLHKYEGDEIVDSKLIDFQTIKYGPPCLDVLQFVYSNTKKSFRNEHFNEFLSFYYKKLSEIFDDRALDLGDYLSREQFFQTCDAFKVQMKLQAVIDRCLTSIPDQAYQDYISDEEKLNDFIFVNRAKYFVEVYTNFPAYRELVSEDLRELRDMLCELK